MWVKWGLELLIQTKKEIRAKIILKTSGTPILRHKLSLCMGLENSRCKSVGANTDETFAR